MDACHNERRVSQRVAVEMAGEREFRMGKDLTQELSVGALPESMTCALLSWEMF